MSFLGQLFGSAGGAFLGNLILPGVGSAIGGFLGDKLAGGSNTQALLAGAGGYYGFGTPGGEVYPGLGGAAGGSAALFGGADIAAGYDPMLLSSFGGGSEAFGGTGASMFPGFATDAAGPNSYLDRLFKFGGNVGDWLSANKGTLRTGLGLYGFGRMQAAKRAMRPPSIAEMQGSPEYAAALDAAQRSSIASGGFGSGQMAAAAAAVGPQIYQQLYGRNMEMAGGRANADMASLLMLSSILGG